MHSTFSYKRLFVLLAGLLAIGAGAQAQTRWTVDPKYSIAWWQVSPHLNHLWATSCPEEPSWKPGEGRSGGWSFDKNLKRPRTGYANDPDTINVPLYPRDTVKSTISCTEAVGGQVLVADTVSWRVLRGVISVKSGSLVTGEDRRDNLTRTAILESNRYPEIRFAIDSVTGITRTRDTLHGTGYGILTLRGVSKPVTAVVEGWREAGGLRVTSKIRIPAKDLVPEWGLSKFALGLGIGTKIWYDLFIGADMLLRPEGATHSSN
jgi:polyisoprenoid-binding protein YceI